MTFVRSSRLAFKANAASDLDPVFTLVTSFSLLGLAVSIFLLPLLSGGVETWLIYAG
jgi:hypothetical protein